MPSVSDCYWALGAVHEAFSPVIGKFKDYIVAPKPNGYQSLHTCVKPENGRIFEVQIRTSAMHEKAEWASAAHWRFKMEQATAPLLRAPLWLRRFFGGIGPKPPPPALPEKFSPPPQEAPRKESAETVTFP